MTRDDAGGVLVIGVGNRFRGDDAIGPVVLDRLSDQLPPDVRTVESDGDPVGLLNWWQGARLAIVVDGVVAGGKRGTVYRFNGDQALPARFFRESSHLIGLADAIALGRELGKMPQHLIVFGIEIDSAGYGTALSLDVSKAGDDVVEEIVRVLESLPPRVVDNA